MVCRVQTHPFGGFPPNTPALVPLFDPQETFNKVTWKGNLSYKISEQLLAYITASSGFRGGGVERGRVGLSRKSPQPMRRIR